MGINEVMERYEPIIRDEKVFNWPYRHETDWQSPQHEGDCLMCHKAKYKDFIHIGYTKDSNKWEAVKQCPSCKNYVFVQSGDKMGGQSDSVDYVDLETVLKYLELSPVRESEYIIHDYHMKEARDKFINSENQICNTPYWIQKFGTKDIKEVSFGAGWDAAIEFINNKIKDSR